VSRALRFRRRRSALAHAWLDGRRGVEIGSSEMNTFGLQARNVGRRDKICERGQLARVGCFSPIHIEAAADCIPLPDGSQDFVFTSHVIEHCVDFIRALVERVRIFGDALVLVDEQRVDDKIGNGFTLVYRKEAVFAGLGQDG
jgi:hypothetical protein